MSQKILKIFEKISISLSLLLFVLIFVVGIDYTSSASVSLLESLFPLLFVIGFVVSGYILSWPKSKKCFLIGNCFLATGLFFNFILWFALFQAELETMSAESESVIALGFVFSLIALILYFVSLILHGLGCFLFHETSCVDLDKRVESYKEYKKLFEEGLISQEELDLKKAQLLNIKPDKKVNK